MICLGATCAATARLILVQLVSNENVICTSYVKDCILQQLRSFLGYVLFIYYMLLLIICDLP